MPKMVKILVDYRETDGVGISRVKFAAGHLYPVDAETARRVALGDAEVVEVADAAPPDADPAPAAATAAAAAEAPAGMAPKAPKAPKG